MGGTTLMHQRMEGTLQANRLQRVLELGAWCARKVRHGSFIVLAGQEDEQGWNNQPAS